MTQELSTPDAPVQPLEAGTQTGVAPTGPEKAQPSPEAAPAEPVTEAEPGAEEKKQPWVDVKDVEGLRDHVGPLLEESEKTGYDKRTGEYDQYAQPYLQQQTQRWNDINSGVGRMVKGMEMMGKAAKAAGTADVEALDEWYESHQDVFRDFIGTSNRQWQFHGAKSLVKSLADAIGDPGMSKPFENRLDMFMGNVPDPNLFPDIVKAFSAKSTEAIKKPLQDKITSLEAQIEDLKAKKRPEGPDTTPKGGGGGGDDNKRLLDPTTPHEELVAIRARQKAAGE